MKPKIGDGRADAAAGNNDASNNNAHGRPVIINKKNRVPCVTLLKNNRLANANHKLVSVNTGDEKLCFDLYLLHNYLKLYIVRDSIIDEFYASKYRRLNFI